MIDAIRKHLRFARRPKIPAIPSGERVYAIGDIHGRCDLFLEIIEAIERDNLARGEAESTVILLGDLIDRGPDSAAVIAAARAWQQVRKVRIIAGNHEEVFFKSFLSLEVFDHFMQFGGRETILSYPHDRQAFTDADLAASHQIMIESVPFDDIDFIARFEEYVVVGDYLFVHAGIRPGEVLEAQQLKHMRWIREPFLSYRGDHGFVVVHGHTISTEPDFQHNRIGLDTGAYMTGRLTALGLEGTSRWLIEARETDEGLTSSVWPVDI